MESADLTNWCRWLGGNLGYRVAVDGFSDSDAEWIGSATLGSDVRCWNLQAKWYAITEYRGTYVIKFTASDDISPDASQTFTLTVNEAPSFGSPNSTTFTIGTAGTTFNVIVAAFPLPTITETGTLPIGPLPKGLKFVDNKNGSATISGTPSAGTTGTYNLTFTASNGLGKATQTFTPTVH